MKKVVVVGAGAGGIIAAWRAASLGAQVTLLEKTPRIGTKILISGGGKCNITHDGPVEEVLKAFRRNEATFLRPSAYRFTNEDIKALFTDHGLEIYTRPNGRVFPVHGTAKDVVAILRSYLIEAGVEIELNTPVTGLQIEGCAVKGVQAGDNVFEADAFVISVGGSSYPNSGTTGDGFWWMRGVGHQIVPIIAALAPIEMRIESASTLIGVALRDIVLKARKDGKEIMRWRDDLLFTHRGVSGPTVLGLSRETAEQMPGVRLEVDVTPDETFESLTEKILAETKANPRRQVSTWIETIAPKSASEAILKSAQVAPETMGKDLPKAERNRLVSTLKAWDLGQVGEVVLDKGEVVAGGVSLTEVDPKTMASKVVGNLYLCGEILDIAGPVGGYNLFAAFATGFVAGESAAS